MFMKMVNIPKDVLGYIFQEETSKILELMKPATQMSQRVMNCCKKCCTNY